MASAQIFSACFIGMTSPLGVTLAARGEQAQAGQCEPQQQAWQHPRHEQRRNDTVPPAASEYSTALWLGESRWPGPSR